VKQTANLMRLAPIVFCVAVACSSTPAAAPVPDSCGPACRSVAVCYASSASGKPRTLDQAGCEKQCGLELAGKGFLSLDVAKRVFSQMAAVAPQGDVDCKLQQGFLQFTSNGGYLSNVSDPEYLRRCTTTNHSLCPDSDEVTQLGECFDYQYTFNDSIRGEFEKCAKVSGTCLDFRRCYNETAARVRPVCEPWFGPTGAICQ
jgi:hypothetical protein